MAHRYLEECKILLELEGDETLSTVQALCLMYLTSALLGMDRVGLMYRYAAYGMLHRLQLEVRFSKLKMNDTADFGIMQVLSKVLWGLFCFEGYVFRLLLP